MPVVRFPPSLRNVEDLPFERGIDSGHETVRFRWNRFAPLFADDVRVENSLLPFRRQMPLADRRAYKERRFAALAKRRGLTRGVENPRASDRTS